MRLPLSPIALAVLMACSRGIDLSHQAASPETRRLVGSWTIQLRVDRTALPGVGDARIGRVADGALVLVANRTLTQRDESVGVPLAYGSYDLDLLPLGIRPSEHAVPAALVGRLGGDSLGVVLEAAGSEARIVMRGAVLADTIRGRWEARLSRNDGGGGSFEMRRREGP